jgi:hypothetical protein
MLGANDRCSPSGAVIAAYLSAVVEGDTIVGWMKNSGFIVREVQLDGTLAPLDLTAFGRSGGFAPISLPLFQGLRLDVVGAEISLSCMGQTPQFA